jgi:DNA-binding NtrC family response regulator
VTASAHILIVDDDPALLEALPEALRLRVEGIEVDTCESASAALERIEHTDYDVIVTDIKMPGMDGLALLSTIKARRPAIPTLLITGHGERDLAVRALRGGAYDYITKPIDRDDFILSLEQAIETRRLQT